MNRIARAAWAALFLMAVAVIQPGTPARADEPVKIGVILPYSVFMPASAAIRSWLRTYESMT